MIYFNRKIQYSGVISTTLLYYTFLVVTDKYINIINTEMIHRF